MSNCLRCDKEFIDKRNGGLPQKYCCEKCQRAAVARKRYYTVIRNSPEHCKKRSKNMKDWYQKNKKRQSINTLKSYYKNKPKWREQNITRRKRVDILKFINEKCYLCGKKKSFVLHHLSYGNYPRMHLGVGHKKENLLLLKRYAEENIIGFCSQKCHMRFHRNDSHLNTQNTTKY